MSEVETLLPHRSPFLFIDELISLSKDEIVGTKKFSDSDQSLKGNFPELAFVPGVILIESMAQCGGAGIKKLAVADGLFGLASIECARFFKGVEYEKIFKMVIKNLKLTDRLVRQSGIGYVDDVPCVELTWTCVRLRA